MNVVVNYELSRKVSEEHFLALGEWKTNIRHSFPAGELPLDVRKDALVALVFAGGPRNSELLMDLEDVDRNLMGSKCDPSWIIPAAQGYEVWIARGPVDSTTDVTEARSLGVITGAFAAAALAAPVIHRELARRKALADAEPVAER